MSGDLPERLRFLYQKYRREGMSFCIGYIIIKERVRSSC